MKHSIGLFLIPILLTIEVQAQSIGPELRLQQDLAPGLVYRHYQADTAKGQVPLSIHVLQAHLDSVYMKSVLAMDQIVGQETTSSMVQRMGALAGINGGFSYSNNPWNIFHGDPRDFLVLEGKILSEPLSSRASFGYTTHPDGTQSPFLDQVQLQSWAQFGSGHILPIHGINRKRDSNEIVLYTPEWGRSTLTDTQGLELIIENGYVSQENHLSGSNLIWDQGLILSASGTYKDSVAAVLGYSGKVMIEYELSSLLHPETTPQISHSSYHTAGPILVWKGIAISHLAEEQIPNSFSATQHPRTAIGISQDSRTLWWVVVDGRQARLSQGMTLPELSEWLITLGAYQGYNLDGGGSSTMVLKGKVVNSPSDPQERRRCDALLLFPK